MLVLFRYLLLLSLSLMPIYAHDDKVSLQLSWLHQFQFAGFYAAKERGYYEEIGLDVTIKELKHDSHVVDDIVTQTSEFGVGRSSLLIDHSNGLPVVALGAIFQRSPSVLITTDPDISTPKDLRGKKIMVTRDQSNSASFMAMLFSDGVRLDDIELQPHSFRLQDLIDGKTDAMACYLSNEPYLLQKQGIDFHILNPADHGADYYGDILFTSQQQIIDHPDRTKAFYDASLRGWKWALENIEEMAALIYDKYNSQQKTLDSLIFEGEALKGLAYDEQGELGHLSREKIETILKLYDLSRLTSDQEDSLDDFIDPLGLNKIRLKLGVLSKRGDENTLKRWTPLADYLNRVLQDEHIEIVPIHFNRLNAAIVSKKIDFLLTNPMNYINMAHHYGVSRIATLNNRGIDQEQPTNHFGGVIFRKKAMSTSPEIASLKGKRLAAVNANSFGGWVMAYELLKENGLNKDDISLSFLGTHDAVVQAVLAGSADVGTVRTDTLEHMSQEGSIDLDDIELIHSMKHEAFPFMVSTSLNPEWPFARLGHVPEHVANHILTALISMPSDSEEAIDAAISGWSVPLDYTSVRTMLKRLKLPPYEHLDFGVSDVIEAYRFWIFLILFLIILLLVRNLYYTHLNNTLERKVRERTTELSKANKHLEELAHTDMLTGIYNRRYLIETAENYFKVSQRNGTPLQVLSIDIDYFKNINDTYGHQTGDAILRHFCDNVQTLLRESDLFGRVGGEEFVICLQNTSLSGAELFAQRLLEQVRGLSYIDSMKNNVTFTVSIGIAELQSDRSFDQLLNRSDQALYKAKHSGRDRVKTL